MSNGRPFSKTAIAYSFGIVGTFLIMAGLVWTMRHYTQPAPATQSRAAERAKNIAELRAESAKTLDSTDWQDKGKGLVRLKIDRAMELTVKEWQDPAKARKNLIERVEKATAPAPAAPSPFE